MSLEIVSAIAELRERVRRLERLRTRSSRGRVNQRRAAEYLGRSREFLRQLHLRGEGPRGLPTGPTASTIWTWASPTPPELPNNENGAGPRPRPIDLATSNARSAMTGESTVVKKHSDVPVKDIAAAATVIDAESPGLIENVLRGHVGLLEAAESVRRRVRLVKAYREADRDDRKALGKMVGIDRVFDEAIAPLL